jgi:hypothetical protein
MIQAYAFTAIAGLILAGSDGPLFPSLNIAGCLIACIAMTLANRRMERGR